MAKNRCPSCGAAHKEPPGVCRLCGYVMDGSVETPMASNIARPVAAKKRGAGSLALDRRDHRAGAGRGRPGAAHRVGRLDGQQGSIEKIGIHGTTDGWKTVTDPEGGFTVEPAADGGGHLGQLRSGRQRRSSPAGWPRSARPPRSTPRSTSLYGKVHPNPGESAEDTVGRLGDAKMAARRRLHREPHPDQLPGLSGHPVHDQPRSPSRVGNGYENALLFLKGDELYVIETVSIYSGDPADDEFNRVLNSLHFTRLTTTSRACRRRVTRIPRGRRGAGPRAPGAVRPGRGPP